MTMIKSEFVKHHETGIFIILTRIFIEAHHLMYKKLNLFFYIFAFNFHFFKITPAKPCYAENWHALLHEQYF